MRKYLSRKSSKGRKRLQDLGKKGIIIFKIIFISFIEDFNKIE